MLISIRYGDLTTMSSLLATFGRRTVSLTLVVAVTAAASLGLTTTEAGAAVRYHGGGFHAGHAMGGFGRGGFGHGGGFRYAGFGRGGRGGFGGFGGFEGGDFGDGRVAAGIGAASLALGIFGAVASAAAEQQAAAQPRCGIANQPVLRSNGTYFYLRVQVCQ